MIKSVTVMVYHIILFLKRLIGISTIVPIHKGSNLKASESKNYRAVALII